MAKVQTLTNGAVTNVNPGSAGQVITVDSDGKTLIYADASPGASLPDQTGHSGEYLTTNGATASWGVLAVVNVVTAAVRTNTSAGETKYIGQDGATDTVDPTDPGLGAVEECFLLPPCTIVGVGIFANTAPGLGETHTATVIANNVATDVECITSDSDVSSSGTGSAVLTNPENLVVMRMVVSDAAMNQSAGSFKGSFFIQYILT